MLSFTCQRETIKEIYDDVHQNSTTCNANIKHLYQNLGMQLAIVGFYSVINGYRYKNSRKQAG